MTNKETLSPKRDWEETINNMSYDELEECIADPSICYPEFYELAKDKLEELKSYKTKVFLKALKHCRCKFLSLEDNDRIRFRYSRKMFIAECFFCCDSVHIDFLHDTIIEKENEAKLSRLVKAVNGANKLTNVNTVFFDDIDEDFVFVKSQKTINLLTQGFSFEFELALALEDCLAANYCVKQIMKRRYNRRKDRHDCN